MTVCDIYFTFDAAFLTNHIVIMPNLIKYWDVTENIIASF